MSGIRFVLGSRNPGKAREIRSLLAGLPDIHVEGAAEIGLEPEPEEDRIEAYETFRENAVAKARYFSERAGLPAIADDSGLEVDALDRAPGVRSKRFASDAGADDGFDSVDEANNALLLERLRDVPDPRRTARFVCVAAVVIPDGGSCTLVGTCPGVIAREPRGDGGFGYDPLFLLPDLDRTFAEIPDEQKNRRSHRAHAFRALAAAMPTLARGVDRGGESC